MKKLKLDRKGSQKIVALALATTIATTTLSGCSLEKRQNILKGTILENSRVITFEDGHIDIATKVPSGEDLGHIHYKSIITNEKFTSTECTWNGDYKYDILSDESIVAYLTAEEIANATADGLTNEDIKNIILRIFSEHEETKQSPKR